MNVNRSPHSLLCAITIIPSTPGLLGLGRIINQKVPVTFHLFQWSTADIPEQFTKMPVIFYSIYFICIAILSPMLSTTPKGSCETAGCLPVLWPQQVNSGSVWLTYLARTAKCADRGAKNNSVCLEFRMGRRLISHQGHSLSELSTATQET